MSSFQKAATAFLLAVQIVAASEKDWVVTATTPWVKPKLVNPLAPDRTQQPPYVHWTCYNRDLGEDLKELPTHKLQCCKAIFEMIQREPEKLRFGEKIGGTFRNDKKEFMSHCTSQLQFLVLDKNDFLLHNHDGMIPRFTLMQIPEGTTLNIRSWSQAMGWNDPEQGWGIQWFYGDIHSPIELAPHAKEVYLKYTDGKEDTQEAIFESGSFKTNYTATFVTTDVYNEDERYLRFNLNVTTPPMNASKKNIASLEVLLVDFFPAAISLGKGNTMNRCRLESMVGCGQLEPGINDKFSCRIDVQRKIRPAIGQSDAWPVRMTMTLPPVNDHVCQYNFFWHQHIVLEDDENTLIPPPVVHSASLTLQEGDEIKSIPWYNRINMTYPEWANPDNDLTWIERDEL